jgi:hypothetical protein
MQKFLLLIREDLKVRANLSHEDHVAQARLVGEWVDQMAAAGHFLDASALTNKGKYVGRGYINSDGPFIEAKECISGFILIQAADLQEASTWAQACPLVGNGVGVVELRELQDIPETRQ